MKHKKHTGLFHLPTDLFKMNLDPISFMIYAYLVSIKETNDMIHPSISVISQELRIPRSIVYSRIKILEEKAYIKRIQTANCTNNNHLCPYSIRYIACDFEKPWCRKIFSRL